MYFFKENITIFFV